MFINIVAHGNNACAGDVAGRCLDAARDMLRHARVNRTDNQRRDMRTLWGELSAQAS